MSGSGPPGGTLRVGGHVSAAFNYHSKTIHAEDKIEGGTEGEAPPIGKGGKSSSPHHVMGEHAGGWREVALRLT